MSIHFKKLKAGSLAKSLIDRFQIIRLIKVTNNAKVSKSRSIVVWIMSGRKIRHKYQVNQSRQKNMAANATEIH